MSVNKTKGLRRVVVTGVGMVTSMGLDAPTVWRRLLAGESGIRHLENFDKGFVTKYRAPADFPLIAGEIAEFNLKEILQSRKNNLSKEDLKQVKYTDRFTQFALAASLEAIQDSRLELEKEDPERCGVIIASGMGGVGSWEESMIRSNHFSSAEGANIAIVVALAGRRAMNSNSRTSNASISTTCVAASERIPKVRRQIATTSATRVKRISRRLALS